MNLLCAAYLVKELSDLIEEQSTRGAESFCLDFNPYLSKITKIQNLLTKVRKMSHHIPFEIQSEIMKRLPVKSLIHFRSVSKQWKSCIDNPEFIKKYHINHTNPQHHLLLQYMLDDNVESYTSIIDDDTFPQQKFPLTALESLSLLRNIITLSSVGGLLCFCGDIDSKTEMAIIWNPTVRKSVGIGIPKPKSGYIVVCFGVCSDTSDHKLVTITVNRISNLWVVEVFTLNTHVWRTVYTGAPFKSCDLSWLQVCVDGVIYFRAYDDVSMYDGVISNIVISFDLKSVKFGEVCLPRERLLDVSLLDLAKVNDSLGLLEYFNEGEESVCGVWTRNNGANKPFTKIYTVKVEGKELHGRVLGFRNNGDVVIEVVDDDNYEASRIEVYEPSSGHIHGVGINGKLRTYVYARSYMETLLLLDESDSILYYQR